MASASCAWTRPRSERVWVSAEQCRATPAARRAAWLQETAGVSKKKATQLAAALSKAKTDEAVLPVLDAERVKGSERKARGEYALQPGTERRRTSSHYTPKSLPSPIVAKTLEPLLRGLRSNEERRCPTLGFAVLVDVEL